MDVNIITTFISNVGFPIACVCALFYSLERERAEHKEEIEKTTTALNNNTLTIQKLLDKMEGLENDSNFKRN